MATNPRDRLIVALDVPSIDEAVRVVDRLDNVSFFKVGLQLFMTGDLPRLLRELRDRQQHVFIDLKVPSDIANTIASVVELCVEMKARFLTLSESMPPQGVAAAKAAREGKGSEYPKFLTVPFVSSLGADDLAANAGETDLDAFVVRRAGAALRAGVDGIIASGPQIAVCRRAFPAPVIIVSPGIRPSGAGTDDHKRSTTPAEAIRAGADYLVVGRPIAKHADPRAAAEQVIAEIAGAS